MSSDVCKTLLVQQAADRGCATQASEWKRVRKHKDALGRWCRDFSHARAGEATVVEDPSFPEGMGVTWGSVPAAALMQGKFTPVEVAGALQLFQRLIATTNDDDPNDDVEDRVNALLEGAEYKRFGHALSAHVGFCFPKETYGNEGVDPTDVHQPVGNLNVVFEFRAASDPNEEPHWGLLEMIKPLLPSCLDFVDEMHAEADKACTDSVLAFARNMEERGFCYSGRDINADDGEDLFGERLRAALHNPGATPHPFSAQPSLADVRQAIESGDAMALRQLLDAGAQADAKAPRGAHPTLQSCSWLGLALERHSTECFQVLLASGANPDTGHGPHSLAVAALAHALKKDGHPWGDFVGPLLAHPKAPLGKGGWGPDLLRELFQPQVAPSPTLTKALERVSQAIEAQVGTAGLNAVWIDAAGGHPPRFTQAFLDRAAMDAPGFLGLLIDEGQYRLAATLATEHRVQSSQVVCGPQQTPLDAWFEIKAAEEEQERLHEQNKGFRMFVGPVSGGSCSELPNRFLEEFAAINVLRGVFRRNATLASRPKP